MMPNQLIGSRYLVKRTLGEGGMANVYLAHDLILDRDVSVKTLRFEMSNDKQTINRFRREVIAATELIHPNIVTIYDFDDDAKEGLHYLVMEYIDGMDLKTYIKKYFPLPLKEVVKILNQVLSAVSMAHKSGIIHRDLKPQNILIDRQGNAKISDFGIAITNSEVAMTQTNTILGSVHYLSPEQARGGMATDKSDVYSLGIILYELLVGKVPFNGENAVTIALKHSQEKIPFVTDYNKDIPQSLENIVLKATAKNPNIRYNSVDDMLFDLKTSLDLNRINEKRFDPTIVENDDITKVIPIDEIKNVKNDFKIKEDKNVKNKPQNSKKKNRLGWFLLLLIILSSIGLFFGFNYYQQVTLPSLKNKSQSAAVSLIQESGLKVGSITRNSSQNVVEGRVLNSNPDTNKKIKRGSTVNLVISSGKKLVKFGDYTGQIYQDVYKELSQKGYNVVQKRQYSKDIPMGEIISQNLGVDTKVDPETTDVIFDVSSGPKKFDVPDFKGQNITNFYNWANQNGIKILQPNMINSDDISVGNIVDQTIEPGKKASDGDAMQVTVSNGPKEEIIIEDGNENNSDDSKDKGSNDDQTSNKNSSSENESSVK